MKRSKYIKSIAISAFIILTATVIHSLFAKYKSVGSERSFDRAIIKNDLNVVMLYEKSKEVRKDKDLRKKLKRTREMFRDLSKKLRYKEGEVAFISVDIAKKDLDELANDLNITQLPTFVLYDDGIAVQNATGKAVQLSGFVARRELQEFIEQHFADEIDDVIEEKEEIREERKEREERRRDYPYFSPYYGYWWSPYSYHYPYYYGYGYPYRYGYPSYGLGFGFTFGGRRRHHRRHRRRHHRRHH